MADGKVLSVSTSSPAPISAMKIDPPPSVGNNDFNDPILRAFDEQQGREIAAVDGLQADLPANVTLPSGLVVSSQYVFFDPGSSRVADGLITFDTDILGVMTSLETLTASDSFGAPQTQYRSPNLRGLEEADSVEIIDSRTLSVHFKADSPGDYIRVFTAPNGDYNHNGVVDAADYTVWRDTLGLSNPLDADGNASGTIENADYAVWAASFGSLVTTPGSAAGGGESVPEPAAFALLPLAALAWLFDRTMPSKRS